MSTVVDTKLKIIFRNFSREARDLERTRCAVRDVMRRLADCELVYPHGYMNIVSNRTFIAETTGDPNRVEDLLKQMFRGEANVEHLTRSDGVHCLTVV